MSSLKFYVRSIRDGKVAHASFEQGNLTKYTEEGLEDFKKSGNKDFENGTLVKFVPDKEVFINDTEGYGYDRICSEIKNISFLNKGVRFIVETTNGKRNEYYSENGIADFISDLVKKPLMKAPIIVSKTDGIDELEIAFMWTADQTQEHVFVNGLYVCEGGSPVTGARTTTTTSMKRLSGCDFTPDLIRKGLVYAINCKVANPSFANQTKSKINNPSLRTLASAAFKEGLEMFANSPDFAAIVEMMKKFTAAEKAAEKARQDVLNHQKKMNDLRNQKVAFIDKLKDADVLGEDSILCIVEGDSAGESIINGRDYKKYGVLKLRGRYFATTV